MHSDDDNQINTNRVSNRDRRGALHPWHWHDLDDFLSMRQAFADGDGPDRITSWPHHAIRPQHVPSFITGSGSLPEPLYCPPQIEHE